MQVVLGSRGDYTVRAVLYLARHPGRRRRREISDAMEIPDTFLPQILGALVRAGIARSTVGRLGGYELARPAEDVTLREVVEVAEGPIRSHKCILRGGPCYWGEKCAIHDAWLAAEEALTERLAGTSFAELARADWDIEQARRASGVPLDAPRPERLHTDATGARRPR
jgi:Rrf2 family protein